MSRFGIRVACLLLLALGAGPALAQESVDVPAEISLPQTGSSQASAALDPGTLNAYCRYVSAVADSGGALLLSPWIFANGGTVLGSDPLQDSTVRQDTVKPRVQVGVGLSPTRMLRATTTRDLARAQCKLYATAARTAFETANLFRRDAPSGIESAAALRAKIQVLSAAAQQGHALLDGLRRKLEASLATVEEYGTLALKVNALEHELGDAELALAALPPRSSVGAWKRARAEGLRAESEVEQAESSLRKSQAFEIILRGGYDQIFGVEQKIPVFGLATVRFSPGWFFQGPAEARAARARREWAERRDMAGTPEFVSMLRSQLNAATSRLGVVQVTLADLESRRELVKGVPGEHAQRYAEFLWLELAELRAERAYLDEQIKELRATLQTTRELRR